MIEFDNGNPGTNVFWDNGINGQVIGPATLVTGATNTAITRLVHAESKELPTPLLLLGTGGQAGGVTRDAPLATDPVVFAKILVTLTRFDNNNTYFIEDFSVNIDAQADGDLKVVVDGLDATDTAISTMEILENFKGNGQNRLRIRSDSGDRFNKITLEALNEAGNTTIQNFVDIVQFRLGGITEIDGTTPSAEIPEPGTMAIFAGLALVCLVNRRRKRRRDGNSI